jgi:NTE family protein
MTRAFVLSGGGSLGSVQVGMLLALAEAGIEPDLVVGTSVGAINAAWVAGRPGLDGVTELAAIWRGVERDDVFPADPVVGLRGLLGRSDHLVSSDALRDLLRRHLTFERLEDAPVRLEVVATDIITGIDLVLDHGDAIEAVTASAAIPGVFPPVTIDGHVLIDGGVTNNTPISHAIDAGADSIWVLPTGYSCDLHQAPHSALGMALQAVTLLVQDRLILDVARYQREVELHVLPPLCPMTVSPLDFSHTAELIDRARQSTRDWMATDHGPDQTAWLGLHEHPQTQPEPQPEGAQP